MPTLPTRSAHLWRHPSICICLMAKYSSGLSSLSITTQWVDVSCKNQWPWCELKALDSFSPLHVISLFRVNPRCCLWAVPESSGEEKSSPTPLLSQDKGGILGALESYCSKTGRDSSKEFQNTVLPALGLWSTLLFPVIPGTSLLPGCHQKCSCAVNRPAQRFEYIQWNSLDSLA